MAALVTERNLPYQLFPHSPAHLSQASQFTGDRSPPHTGKPDQLRLCLRNEFSLQKFTGTNYTRAGIPAGSLLLSLKLPRVPPRSHRVCIYHWASVPYPPTLVHLCWVQCTKCLRTAAPKVPLPSEADVRGTYATDACILSKQSVREGCLATFGWLFLSTWFPFKWLLLGNLVTCENICPLPNTVARLKSFMSHSCKYRKELFLKKKKRKKRANFSWVVLSISLNSVV